MPAAKQTEYICKKAILIDYKQLAIPKNPWFNSTCTQCRKETRMAYKVYKKSNNDPSALQNYSNIRKNYNNTLAQT